MLNYGKILILCSLLLTNTGFCQTENGLVNWLTFKEAQVKNKIQQKPFLIDIYTDWCGWCKHMMKTTYSNPSLANYINTNFYAVKFDAETKDTIEYNGKIYKPISKDPKTPHELAIKFLGQSLSYPSTLFVTNNYEYNLLTQGYLEDKKIEPILVFMTENTWRTTIFDEFNKHFTNTFYEINFKKIPVKIYTVNEVEKLQKTKPKKVLINITASFCNTGKVMANTTFVDTSIANYINKNYYVVNFDVEQKDTLVFNNQKYYNTLINNFPMHNLALKLCNNKLALPSLCILNEDLTTLDVLNFYQSPQQIKPILQYFASNSYKTKTWAEFIKNYSIDTKPTNKKNK